MRNIQPLGPYADTIEGYSQFDPEKVVRFGVRCETFQVMTRWGLATAVAQYYGIVEDHLIEARHAFRGLNRPLMYGGDMEADEKFIIYSWRPQFDYVWVGDRFKGNPEKRTPPPDLVFVVLVQEENPNEYSVVGSIVHWNWVKQDPGLRYAPVAWQERYKARLWSKDL
jgi:hypothetical protein